MIGEKIRSIRKDKGLTIVELSEKINVTSGYISQIERDLISPSLAVLKRLSNALDIPLSVLFLEHPQEKVIRTLQEERTKIKYGNINVELEFITPVMSKNEKNLDFESFIFKLKPKAWVSEQAIRHEAKVWIYVVSGEIDCHIGDKIFKVSRGDSICVPENNAHMIYNNRDEQCEALCILSPAVF